MTRAELLKRALGVLRLGALTALLGGCPTRLHDDPQRDALCASVCAALASCRDAPARCESTCRAERIAASGDACGAEHDAYLACLSKSRAVCEPETSVTASLRGGHRIKGCSDVVERHERCRRPCREAAIVRTASREVTLTGRRYRVEAWQRSLGCAPDAAQPSRRNAPGAPCQAASVCSEVKCPCPTPRTASLVRACVDGSCAARDLACQLVPLTVGYDVCDGQTQPAD